MSSIFSTYSTGENRVTASFLAVLRSLSLDRIQRLLGALLEQSEFELVRFENQPSKGGKGVPDAMIQSSVRLFIETKTVRNAVDFQQIKRHLKRLDEATELAAILLVITPDDVRPQALDSLTDPRVAWASFAALDQAIDEILDDKYEVVSEREEFLLRELQNMLMAEELVGSATDALERVLENVRASIFNPEKTVFAILGTHSRSGHWMISSLYHVPTEIIEKDNRRGDLLF